MNGSSVFSAGWGTKVRHTEDRWPVSAPKTYKKNAGIVAPTAHYLRNHFIFRESPGDKLYAKDSQTSKKYNNYNK